MPHFTNMKGRAMSWREMLCVNVRETETQHQSQLISKGRREEFQYCPS